MMQAQAARYNGHQQSSPNPSHPKAEPPDSDDDQQSGDDLDNDLDDHGETARNGKRKRPISIS